MHGNRNIGRKACKYNKGSGKNDDLVLAIANGGIIQAKSIARDLELNDINLYP